MNITFKEIELREKENFISLKVTGKLEKKLRFSCAGN